MLKSDGLEAPYKPSIDNLSPPQFKGNFYGFKAINIEDVGGATSEHNESNMSLLLNRASGASSSNSSGCNGGNTLSSNCDKKNENLAKRNQLQSIEYRLLPISYQDPNVKLLNTEEGVINNVYSKNFNLAQNTKHPTTVLQQISNNVKDDKVYDKELLNPVVMNWSVAYKD